MQLPKTNNPYWAKDQAKAARANKFIGRGAELLKPIAAWIELRSNGFVDINGKRKLYEIR